MKKIILGFVVAFGLSTYAQVDRTKAPAPAPAPKITLGKSESFTLKNGLKVIIVENHKLPTIQYSLTLDVQPKVEGDKAGYVQMMGDLLGRGTKTKTKAQLDEEIDLIGANISAYSSGAFASGLKKHNEKIIALLADIVLNPNFTQDELDKIKKQTKDGLLSNETDPGAIIENMLNKVSYGENHPYSENMTPTTVDNITLDDIKKHYAESWMPNVSYLAIVGDITKAEIQPLVEKYFGTWAKGTPIETKMPPVNPLAANQVIINDRVGSEQSTIRIAYPIQHKLGDADYIKLRVLNNVLGGGATGRLFMNLREKHGYTYGAYSSVKSDKHVGLFTASADVRTEVTDSAVKQFMFELNKISSSGITSDELQFAKNEMTGSFALGLENAQNVANYAINIDRYKLSKDYYTNYLTNLNAITLDEINSTATKYITPFNMNIVVVGDRGKIEKNLLQFDSDGKITFLDVYGNKAAELREAKNVTIEQVLANYVTAIGGVENINKVKDLTQKGKGSLQGMTLEYVTYTEGFKYNMTLTGMGMTLNKVVFDGNNGKSDYMGNAGPESKMFEDGEKKDIKSQTAIAYETDAKSYNVACKLLGIDLIEGKDAYKVEVTMPSGKVEFAWYEVKSGLKVKTMDSEGSVTLLGNYQEVNGVKFPFKMTLVNFGLEIFLDSITTNTNPADELFIVK